MAKEKTKKQKSPVSNKQRLDISTKAIVDNITFSKSNRFAYYRLSNTVFDFLSNEAKISSAIQISNAFTNLVSEKQEPVECHILVTSTPVDVEAWESQIRKISEDWTRAPGFDDFIRDQAQHLREEEYVKKVTYLGVDLGKRGALDLNAGTFVENGLKGGFDVFKNWLNTALQTPSEEISLNEEKEARRKEEDFFRILSTGNLRAERCTAEEILLIIKRMFYPTMPAPYLDVDHNNRIGAGDLELELSSDITNKIRYLRFNQMVGDQELEGYRAVLSISKLPKSIEFPYSSFPFMYFMHKLALPFDSYGRFVFHPTGNMKKKLEKKKKEQKDELENLSQGGNTVDSAVGAMPTDVTEALQDMQLLGDMLTDGNTPWFEGTYRVVVEAPDVNTLKKFCSIVKQRYSDLDINLNWTSGDQAELFLEQMPGDRIRSTSHKQITNLAMFSTSGFLYSSDVGDLVFGNDGSESASL